MHSLMRWTLTTTGAHTDWPRMHVLVAMATRTPICMHVHVHMHVAWHMAHLDARSHSRARRELEYAELDKVLSFSRGIMLERSRSEGSLATKPAKGSKGNSNQGGLTRSTSVAGLKLDARAKAEQAHAEREAARVAAEQMAVDSKDAARAALFAPKVEPSPHFPNRASRWPVLPSSSLPPTSQEDDSPRDVTREDLFAMRHQSQDAARRREHLITKGVQLPLPRHRYRFNSRSVPSRAAQARFAPSPVSPIMHDALVSINFRAPVLYQHGMLAAARPWSAPTRPMRPSRPGSGASTASLLSLPAPSPNKEYHRSSYDPWNELNRFG